MANKKDIGMLVVIAIGIFIGLAFLVAIANSISPLSATQTQTNETITITSARLVNNNINSSIVFTLQNGVSTSTYARISNFVLTNSTGGVLNVGNYTLNANTGTLTFVNNTGMISGIGQGNTTLATYNYLGSNYINDGGSRSVLTLIVLFGSIAILIFVVVMVFKSEGLRSLLGYGGGAVEASK